MRFAAAVSLPLLLAAAPSGAQETAGGRVAGSSVGQAGQRQTRAQAAPNVEPLGRVNGRISNRVQSRIGNRIDRYYGYQANTVSPFEVASDQARVAGRSDRR